MGWVLKRNWIPLEKRLTMKGARDPLVIYYQYNLTFQSPFITWGKSCNVARHESIELCSVRRTLKVTLILHNSCIHPFV